MDIVGVQASAVEWVADSTKGQTVLESDAVVDGARGYADDGEEPVYEGISSRNGVLRYR